MGFRGGGVNLTPPQPILVFKYPSKDRVNKIILSMEIKNEKLRIFLCISEKQKPTNFA